MAQTLNGGRLFIAGMSLASLAFALDKCRIYSQEREQFGVSIGSFQRVQDVILDMDITLEQGLTWLLDLTGRYEDDTLDREYAAKVQGLPQNPINGISSGKELLILFTAL